MIKEEENPRGNEYKHLFKRKNFIFIDEIHIQPQLCREGTSVNTSKKKSRLERLTRPLIWLKSQKKSLSLLFTPSSPFPSAKTFASKRSKTKTKDSKHWAVSSPFLCFHEIIQYWDKKTIKALQVFSLYTSLGEK